MEHGSFRPAFETVRVPPPPQTLTSSVAASGTDDTGPELGRLSGIKLHMPEGVSLVQIGQEERSLMPGIGFLENQVIISPQLLGFDLVVTTPEGLLLLAGLENGTATIRPYNPNQKPDSGLGVRFSWKKEPAPTGGKA